MFSLIMGLLALGLPFFALRRWEKGRLRRPRRYSLGSWAACCAALLGELSAAARTLAAGDVGGLMDTIGAMRTLGCLLAAGTLIGNLLLLELTAPEEEKEAP